MSDEEWRDERRIRIQASPDRVWAAWAEPEEIARWFADRATGEPTPGATITHIFESFHLELPHEVVEAVPGERLVLRGHGPGGIPFRQEIRVRSDGGETVLDLVHSGFSDDADWDDEYEGIDSGWKLALAILRLYLERYPGRDRTGWLAMRPAAFDYDALARFHRDPDALSRWLTESGGIGDVGDPVSLALRDWQPATLTGRVLARSSREVAISFDELDGALELKAFDAGPDTRMLALRLHSWRADPPPSELVEPMMRAALDRLAAACG
jgi:uncharacterized protein YndB with AHSA1/START domain